MADTEKKALRYPSDWLSRRGAGVPITIATAYDATLAALVSASRVDAIMIGDSLGMTVQGHRSTIPVTLEEMIYHSRLVRRGAPSRFLIGDLPFGSYQASVDSGTAAGLRLAKESLVEAVKLEGADPGSLDIIRRLTSAGVPVMGHLGLTPQSYMTLGGFRVQGRTEDQAVRLLESARALESAGCFAVVLELVAVGTAARITEALRIPTIGIGSGKSCSGQVLVLHDLLGLQPEVAPKHSRRFAELGQAAISALDRFDDAVHSGDFPGSENSFE